MRSPASPASATRRSSQAAKSRFASRRPTPGSTSTCPTPALRWSRARLRTFRSDRRREARAARGRSRGGGRSRRLAARQDGPLARRRRVERNARHRRRLGRAAAFRRAAGSARSPAPRLRLGDAGDDDRRRRRDAADRRHRRPADRAVHAAAQPLSDRARRAFRTHLRHGGRGGRISAARRRRQRTRPALPSSPAPERRSRRALCFRDFPPTRCCRRRSTSPARGASTDAFGRRRRRAGDQRRNAERLERQAAIRVPRDAPVTLALFNATSEPRTMRLGGHVARLLHPLDDGWEPYWRDVFLISPGKTVRLAFVADDPGRWPNASADPAARAAGLRRWFEVRSGVLRGRPRRRCAWAKTPVRSGSAAPPRQCRTDWRVKETFNEVIPTPSG